MYNISGEKLVQRRTLNASEGTHPEVLPLIWDAEGNWGDGDVGLSVDRLCGHDSQCAASRRILEVGSKGSSCYSTRPEAQKSERSA